MITLKFWLLLTMALIVAEAQDFVCKKGKQKGKGKTITIDNGVSYSFKTQAGATYAPNTKCFVTYKRKQASCPMIMFTCSEFNIRNKKASCKSGDKMMIKEDKKKPKSYCQQVGPDVATSAAKLKVFFISKKRSRASGAVCTVSCYEEPTTDDPTEPTTTESETTTATGEEPVSMTNEPTTTGSFCPEERPGFGSTCTLPEMTCYYGNQTCCGESMAEYQMECRGEEWNGFFIDTVCMLGLPCTNSTTTEPSCICPAVVIPVCGTDGQTYSNACAATCGGGEVACQGECPCNTTTEPTCICPEIFSPVCGTDGQTYSNTCKAACGEEEVACEGECPCKPSCICPAGGIPMCGTDGQTYFNTCEAACAGEEVACEGACPCQ